MRNETAEQLGLATFILSAHYARSSIPASWFHGSILPAISHRQIRFAFDDCGTPIAFWTWGLLTRRKAVEMVNSPKTVLHLSDRTEGDLAWIIDFAAPRGRVRDLALHALSFFAEAHEEVFSFRRNANGSLRKINRHDLAYANEKLSSRGFTGITVAEFASR